MNTLIKHLENSLDNADKYDSKITKEILDMDGMTGKKTRHLYNNICSMKDTRYLEIGTWKGSSLCSAMCNNKMTCVAIDNWSEFDGPKNEFLKNFNKFKGENNANFIEKNCWHINVSTLGKFNIYMYDGDHEEISHFQALNHYLTCLDNEFIYIIDDWNWDHVRNGTYNSIKKNNCEILYQKEIFTHVPGIAARGGHPPWGPGDGIRAGKDGDWHNGISIFVLKKKVIYN